MDLEKILSRVYSIQALKEEVNDDIRKNEANINIDKLEFFDFMHKVEKLDLMINALIDEIKTQNEDRHKAQIDKEDILSAFNLDNLHSKAKDIHKEEIKEDDKEEEDIKCYVIGESKEDKKKELSKEEIDDDVKIRPASSIEEAYKRIAKLESLMNERRFIERDEELSHMKDIHSKEEREEMLGKRKIIAQTFTPKARKQSDPEMDKTVAMSKDEFYRHINNEVGIVNNGEYDSNLNSQKLVHKERTYTEEVKQAPQKVEEKKDESFNLDAFRDKKVVKNNDIDYTQIIDMDHTAIIDMNIENHTELKEEEEYDIYNEEKSNGIFDMVKDFLSK